MCIKKKIIYCFFYILFFTSCKTKTGNVVFFHPDGMSMVHWSAIRLIQAGPDGFLEWDKMTNMAVYRGHTKKYLSATSNAGATIHSYGVKVGIHSFGMDQKKALFSASGRPFSILMEAKQKGFSVAICQSGVLVEPGTAVFLAQSKNRKNFEDISLQVVQSGADLIFGGGEKFLLPKGKSGRFGKGVREDGKNLIEWLKQKGYHIVYDKKELSLLPKTVEKVFGVFAYENTYNVKKEEEQKSLPHYIAKAPSIAEMTEYALGFLKQKKRKFFLVVEEEGTDNFSNYNNTEGFFTAGKRASAVVSLVNRFLTQNPDTLFLVTSDSNAGGLLITDGAPKKRWNKDQALPEKTDNNTPLDGLDTNGEQKPFLTFPNRKGIQMPFGVMWPTSWDLYGGILIKASGFNADKVKGIMDNTDIYKLMYYTLFGKFPTLKNKSPKLKNDI